MKELKSESVMSLEERRALTFAILMQDVMVISPDYMMEKWDIVRKMSEPESLLDPINKGIFDFWKGHWKDK
jgi:hypothetical protein